MKNLLNKTLLLLAIVSVSLTGCKKDSVDLFDTESAEDENTVAVFEDDNTMAADFIAAENVGGRAEGGKFLGVANVSYDAANKTVTIDFGATNVQCQDGKMRRGKIITKITEGMPKEFPFSTVTTHQDYYVNDNKVEGTRTERTTGTIINKEVTITVVGRKVSTTDGKIITRNVNHVRKAVREGLTDWTYTTTGTANGTTRKGKTYTNTIVSPLVSKTSCANYLFPISGTIEMIASGIDEKATLDFGTGACDRILTITHKSRTKTITR